MEDEHKNPFEEAHKQLDYLSVDHQKERFLQEEVDAQGPLFLMDVINQLYADVETLKGRFGLHDEPVMKNIELSSLSNEGIGLNRNIPVVLEVYNDEVIARFIDVEATGFGETEYEALDSLKDNLVSLYHDLIDDEESLGPLPKRWLTVLREFVVDK